MKLTPECIPCLLKRVAYEVELSSPDKVFEAVRRSAEVVAEKATADRSSVEVATDIHRCAYDLLSCQDPYLALKRRSNEIALNLLPEAEHLIAQSKDRLRTAMIVSIIGNLMDFGISGSLLDPEHLRSEFLELMDEPLGADDSSRLEELLDDCEEIFFLADNCGEIVFDKLLMRELKSYGPRIALVIKGKPILTDVTFEDIQGLGIDDYADEIVETNGFAIGIDIWSGVNDELVSRLDKCDMIISKGMANYEALSEKKWPRIAYLLRAKCRPVSESIGTGLDTNVIKLFESLKSKG